MKMPEHQTETLKTRAVVRKSSLKRFVQTWWPWALIALAGFYLYRSASPAIDLSKDLGTAPDFTLPDADGNSFRLSEHRGEVVVLNFWATWCPPCRAEIPGFIELQNDLREKGVRFVGISLDEEGFDAVLPYAEKRGINYDLVVDNGRVARLYGGIESIPTTYLIDRSGRIRYEHSGILLKGGLRSALEELITENS